jgi:zinc protease
LAVVLACGLVPLAGALATGTTAATAGTTAATGTTTSAAATGTTTAAGATEATTAAGATEATATTGATEATATTGTTGGTATGATGAAATTGATAGAPAVVPVTTAGQLHYPPLPRYDIPQPQRVVLDNGLVVMLAEDHELPLVSVTAMVRAGARLDPAGKLGLAAITGDLMRTGGVTRQIGGTAAQGAISGDELDDRLEAHAAELDVSFGEDSGSASLSVIRTDFAEFLPLLAAVLRYPAFDEAKLALARDLAKQRLARENDDAEGLAFRELSRLVFGPRSVYGRTPTFATLDAITTADLAAWHRRYIHPERIVLGLSGDFQPAAALAAVRLAFGGWPRGGRSEGPQGSGGAAAGEGGILSGPDAFAYRREPNPGLFVIDKSDVSQSQVIMGHLGILRSDPDYFALQVANEVLSGSFASRLMAHVRTEKGLAYTVEGGVGGEWDHPGLAMLSLSTKASTTAAGVEALLAEARALIAQPPTDDEVALAKQSILAAFVFHSDSPGKVLAQELTFELYGYPLDWLDRFRAAVEAVTTDGVRQAIGRHLHPGELTILVVGPQETGDPALAALSKLTPLPLPDPARPAS